ncbi:hypothetical protein [Myceligenerans halotolerans]
MAVLDRRILNQELRKTEVRYDHMHRHEEPLLWAADAVAWAWQRGGPWQAAAKGLIAEVIETPL